MLGLSTLQVLSGHQDRVWSVTWSPSGGQLCSCSGDKTVAIWGSSGGNRYLQATLEDTHSRTVRACSWSPDGKNLATSSFDATTAVWEVATLEGHENEVKCVAWSPCGTLIATCGRDKSVWVWEALPGHEYACVDVKHGHTQDVKMVAWHPGGELLASCSYDNSIKLWVSDGDDWLCAQTIAGCMEGMRHGRATVNRWPNSRYQGVDPEGMGHTSTVWAVAFEPSGQRMASSSDDGTIKVWACDMKGRQPAYRHLCTLSGFSGRAVYTVDWSKDGLIAAGDGENAIRVFAEQEEGYREGVGSEGGGGASFEQVACVEGAHSADVNCVRWHPTESGVLASAGDDGLVKIWMLKR